MNNGDYEAYEIEQPPSETDKNMDEAEETENFEVYQMLEQYMNIIQTEYKGDDASDNVSDNQIDSSSHAPSDITQAEQKKEKKRGGWKKPKTPEKVSPSKNHPDKIDDSDQSESDDDDMDRNPNASPIIQSKKGQNGAFGYKAKTPQKYQPKMSEVVEETEPESSFNETNKLKKRKPSASPMPTI